VNPVKNCRKVRHIHHDSRVALYYFDSYELMARTLALRILRRSNSDFTTIESKKSGGIEFLILRSFFFFISTISTNVKLATPKNR